MSLMNDQIEEIFVRLENHLRFTDFKGYDPYDMLNCKFISHNVTNTKILLILTQLNKISPINFRPLLGIKDIYNSKAMSLFLSAKLCGDNTDIKNNKSIQFLLTWLINNKSKTYEQYSIGFTHDIALEHYYSPKNYPSLIISLFTMYAFVEYHKQAKDPNILQIILSFYDLINTKLPYSEDDETLWYSYNFEKVNEIYNATAKIGKFYSLLYPITGDNVLLIKIEKILNYLKKKQRDDGSWAYGENISYTDGFHTAFVLEAIWYMRKFVDNQRFNEMFYKGLEHYKKYLFKPNGQPLYFHPNYKPNDIRRFLIETDIRDCAMAIVFFSEIGENEIANKVLKWTLKNMYNRKNGYFYYFKNKLFTNKIEFIRWQAWMIYALSVYLKNLKVK